VILKAVNREGAVLEFVSEAMRGDKDVCLAAVASSGAVLEFVSEAMRGDKDVCLAAMAGSGSEAALPFMSDAMQENKDILKFVALEKIKTGRYDQVRLEGDNLTSCKFYEIFKQENGEDLYVRSSKACESFRDAPEAIRGDKEFVKEVLGLSGYMYPYVILEHCSEALRGDKEVMMVAADVDVGFGCFSLMYASDALKGDKEFVMAALSSGDHAIYLLEHASAALQKDKEVVMVSLKGECFKGSLPKGFERVSEKLREDKEVVTRVVKMNGSALEYASKALRVTRTW